MAGTVVPHESVKQHVLPKYATFLAKERKRAPGRLRVAVGWNVCADVIVPAAALFGQASLRGVQDVGATRDHPVLESAESFVQAFQHFFKHGKAAERFVSNSSFFEELSRDAVAVGRVVLGGNAGLMARGIQEQGHASEVLLGGIVRDLTRPLLHEQVTVVGPTTVKEDMLHIIVEYEKGEQLFPHLHPASRANRFIVSADVENAKLTPALPFLIRILTWKPDVVILAGLHMLDGVKERSERRRLLREVKDALVKFRSKFPAVPLHYEWASIGGPDLAGDILTFIKHNVDSMGFNEEECRAVLAALGSKETDQEPLAHSPTAAVVERALAEMLHLLPASVTRLHFHSLGLHMIAVREEGGWKGESAAVLAGSVVTSLRVCNTTSLGDGELFQVLTNGTFVTAAGERLSFEPHASWTVGGVTFAAAPVLVCKKPVQTVGAGDSISSSSLIRSLRNYGKPTVV